MSDPAPNDPSPSPDPSPAPNAPFTRRLHARARELGTRVCLGIDPRPAAHPRTDPAALENDPARVAREVVAYFRDVLAATHDLLACVKPQTAFFEAMGVPGMIALAQLIADAKSLGLPVIVDAKRGDIGSTAEAYADAYLGDGVWSGDALTVSPWLGRDALEPFVRAARANGRGIFALARTSNPGASDLQDLALAGGGTVADRVAALLTELGAERLDEDGFSCVGAVVGATAPAELERLRAALPHALLLVPGYGAQGGRAEDVRAAFFPNGLGAVVSASRTLGYATSGGDVGPAAREAAERMRDEIGGVLP